MSEKLLIKFEDCKSPGDFLQHIENVLPAWDGVDKSDTLMRRLDLAAQYLAAQEEESVKLYDQIDRMIMQSYEEGY